MDPQLLLQRVREANRAGRGKRALELCNVALGSTSDPSLLASLRLERAHALLALGEWARAEVDCRRVLEGAPASRVKVALARCLHGLTRLEEAAVLLESALEEPDVPPEAWRLASQVFLEQRRNADALAAARRARELEPSRETLGTLLDALAARGEHAELIELTERELSRAPDDTKLWTSLGMSHYSLGDYERAVGALNRALGADPHCVDAHCGLGWVLLRASEFSEGFRHHEYRLKNAGNQRRFGVAPWRGEPVAGKHVLLCAEQGFGDTIQFARFVAKVRSLGARTTLLVPPSLVRLFGSSPELGELSARQPGFLCADFQSLLMSLPHLLGTGAELANEVLPYLRPEPERIAYWRARLPRGPKVALAWQGNPKYGGEPWRSMPFAHFGPLIARLAGKATILSLQKHVGREQLHAAPSGARVLDLGDAIDGGGDAFVDSLAILSLVDQFVTTDSALAHLAGSAGIPAWVLLSQAADWRWGTHAEKTPWYASLRLFRQLVPGDWDGVVARVGGALEAALGRAA